MQIAHGAPFCAAAASATAAHHGWNTAASARRSSFPLQSAIRSEYLNAAGAAVGHEDIAF